GFPSDKVAALSTSLRIQFAQSDKHVSVRPYSGSTEGKGQDLFFAPESKIEFKSTQVDQITSGEYKGWFASSVDVAVGVGNATLRMIGRSAELVQESLAILRELIGSPRFTGTSVAGLVSEVRWQLKARHNLSDDDLLLEFKDQFEHTQIVSWLSLVANNA